MTRNSPPSRPITTPGRRGFLARGAALSSASALSATGVGRAAISAGAISTFGAQHALAQGRAPLRILVGFPPGGGSDLTARILAEPLSKALDGQPVVVENRPGAGGQIAAQMLKSAAPDGLTLFLSHDHTVSILPLVMKNPGFLPKDDFAAVAGFANFANCFAVSGGTPARTFEEYVAWVRKGGGKTAVGIPAPASVPEFMVREIARSQKLDIAIAPYKGGGPMMADMLGNQISAGVESVPGMLENHRAGKLHIVAVMGRSRQPLLPDVPTFAELGISGFEETAYYGIFAPAGVAMAERTRVARALAQVLEEKPVRQRLESMGLQVAYQDGATFAAREETYATVWRRIITESGFKPL